MDLQYTTSLGVRARIRIDCIKNDGQVLRLMASPFNNLNVSNESCLRTSQLQDLRCSFQDCVEVYIKCLKRNGYAHGAGVQSKMSLSRDFICLYHHSYSR